jgi:hypothetical protein
VDWKSGQLEKGEVGLQTPRYKYHYRNVLQIQKKAFTVVGKPVGGEGIYLRCNIAQDWAREVAEGKETVTEVTILEEYQRHQKVFSEEESKALPPS